MSLQKMPPNLPPEKTPQQSISAPDGLAIPEGSYFGRLFEYARNETLEQGKGELIISTVAGILTAALLGQGFWVNVASGVAVFIVTLIVAFLYHFILAPRALDKKLRQKLLSTQLLLEEAKAKDVEADIQGRIKELHLETGFDPLSDGGFGWFVTMFVALVNHQATTTIQEFHLTLSVRGKEYEGEIEPLSRYYILRTYYGYEIEEETEDLIDLRQSNSVPFDHTGRTGWLRFRFSDIPVLGQDVPSVKDEIQVVLTVIDAKDKRHSLSAHSPFKRSGEIKRWPKRPLVL